MRLRDAGRADARDLAYLINLAGEGLPEYLWGLMAEGGESPLEVGMQRAARQEGGFSYRHARVFIDRGRLVGVMWLQVGTVLVFESPARRRPISRVVTILGVLGMPL